MDLWAKFEHFTYKSHGLGWAKPRPGPGWWLWPGLGQAKARPWLMALAWPVCWESQSRLKPSQSCSFEAKLGQNSTMHKIKPACYNVRHGDIPWEQECFNQWKRQKLTIKCWFADGHESLTGRSLSTPTREIRLLMIGSEWLLNLNLEISWTASRWILLVSLHPWAFSTMASIVLDDGSPQIVYGGGIWSINSQSHFFGRSMTYNDFSAAPDSSNSGTYRNLTFFFHGMWLWIQWNNSDMITVLWWTGTSVASFGITPNQKGSQWCLFSIDGGQVTNSSFMDPAPQSFRQLYQSPMLPEGTHNITLTWIPHITVVRAGYDCRWWGFFYHIQRQLVTKYWWLCVELWSKHWASIQKCNALNNICRFYCNLLLYQCVSVIALQKSQQRLIHISMP